MSLFNIKQWWSNHKTREDPKSEGTQHFHCLVVDKFNSHNDSDCVLVAGGNVLNIYKPNRDEDTSANILEMQLDLPVLHIETGKYVPGATDRQILLLHPQSFAIYDLHRKQGHTDAGDQNLMSLVLKHSFTRKAFSLMTGPFGGIKSRDLICVQGLDGSLSFFDQDSFLFLCLLTDVIVPGPLAYVASPDLFVLCKSTWVIEIYSFEQLREFSELNTRQNKKQISQWVYNAGEEISAVQVIQTSNNFSSILALGERHLYCFQDNGLMKFMKKLDYMPICFYAYLIGWYYEPTCRLLTMVASEDSKLFIYEGPTLLWSCAHLHVPISLSRCFLKGLPGGIVTLSSNGIVTVGYLGTEPDLTPDGPAVANEIINVDEIRNKLQETEAALKLVLDSKDTNEEIDLDKLITIKADSGKPTKIKLQPPAAEELGFVDACPIIVVLNCPEPKLIQTVQVTYICHTPIACIDTTICLNSVNGTEIIETQVYLTNDYDISDSNIKIMITITDATGKIYVTSKNILLPLSFICTLSKKNVLKDVRIELEASIEVDLIELFSEYSKEDISLHNLEQNTIVFNQTMNDKTIVVTASNQTYSVESQDTPEMITILETLVYKLMEYSVRMNVQRFHVTVKMTKELQTLLVHKFLKSIEIHAKERIKMKALEKELSILHRQFTLIQKKLLVQYGSSPPGDCDPLEYLMRDTYERIGQCAHGIIQGKDTLVRAGCTMAANGRLILLIISMVAKNRATVHLAEEMLSMNSIYDDNHDWEESVTQSLSHVLNSVFKQTDKEREKLAPVTEQGVLSHINLKRFLRQIRIILEKMLSKTMENTKAKATESIEKTENETRVIRMEELVEVI